jgi:hypothetical protein
MTKENEQNLTNLIKKINYYQQEPDREKQAYLDIKQQGEAKKLEEFKELKDMLEDTGVRKLFENIIKEKVVRNGSIEDGDKHYSTRSGDNFYSYHICLIFNQPESGHNTIETFDFITISAYSTNRATGEKRKYINESGWTPDERNGNDQFNIITTYNSKKSERFYKNDILNIEEYVAYKIASPDHHYRRQPSGSY